MLGVKRCDDQTLAMARVDRDAVRSRRGFQHPPTFCESTSAARSSLIGAGTPAAADHAAPRRRNVDRTSMISRASVSRAGQSSEDHELRQIDDALDHVLNTPHRGNAMTVNRDCTGQSILEDPGPREQ